MPVVLVQALLSTSCFAVQAVRGMARAGVLQDALVPCRLSVQQVLPTSLFARSGRGALTSVRTYEHTAREYVHT